MRAQTDYDIRGFCGDLAVTSGITLLTVSAVLGFALLVLA